MKKISLIFTLFLCSTFLTLGQTLERDEVSISESGWKKNQFYKGDKKIYINSFEVFCEVYREDKDTKQGGGGFGRMMKGSASVVQTLGLSSVEAHDLQVAANKLYKDFVDQLTKEGFALINTEEAGQTETFQDWQKVDGPVVKDSGLPGVLSIVPSDFSYFILGTDKDGAEKKSKGLGRFMAKSAGGTGTEFKAAPKLSKELDDAIIVDVRLSYLFTQEGDNWLRGDNAKVIVKTSFRMGSGTVSQLNKSKSIVRTGSETTIPVNSYINFSKGKAMDSSEAMHGFQTKKDVYIEGVIDSDRVTSTQRQDLVFPTSFNSYQIGGDFYTDVEDRKSTNANWIDVDSKKYAEGMYLAGSAFIRQVLDEFKTNK